MQEMRVMTVRERMMKTKLDSLLLLLIVLAVSWLLTFAEL